MATPTSAFPRPAPEAVNGALFTIGCLFEPGDVIEIRAVNVKRNRNNGESRGSTLAGYFDFDNKQALTLAIRSTDAYADGVYTVFNKLNPVLLARANNRLKAGMKSATADKDILERRWLYVDVDPVRPGEMSSTQEEHQLALNTANEVREFLAGCRWPEGIYADSGNGAALLIRLPELSLERSDDLVKRCLQALQARFTNSRVNIDQATFNRARLCKLFGTMACKGDSMPDRPHRRSRIIDGPERITAVSVEALEQLAAEAAPTRKVHATPGSSASTTTPFDIEAWISGAVGLEVIKGPDPYEGGRKWILRQCPFNPEHEKPAILQLPNGALVYSCLHTSCKDNDWKTLRLHIEPDHKIWERPSAAIKMPGGGLDRAPWPEPLGEEAFHGLAGEWCRIIEPHSEADVPAHLVQFLLGFGNAIGRRPFFTVAGTEHHTNLFALLVGDTAKSRKGTSWGQDRLILRLLDQEWSDKREMGGLSTGEGLIHFVRDPAPVPAAPKRGKGRGSGQAQEADPGVTDKRLLVVEAEFARVLKVSERESSTLSAVLRDAWDGRTLAVMIKRDAPTATGAHISIIGHITTHELRRRLTEEAIANGFANRFLYVCTKRVRCLPEGGALHQVDLEPFSLRLNKAFQVAKQAGELHRDQAAKDLWDSIYRELWEGQPGLFGSVTARSAPLVLRLSCVYALLDCSAIVRVEHLRAARAVWRYCEQSARFIFGTATGNPVADQILATLQSRGDEGMTRNEMIDHFARHRKAGEIDQALLRLAQLGLVRSNSESTGGRSATRWFLSI